MYPHEYEHQSAQKQPVNMQKRLNFVFQRRNTLEISLEFVQK